MALSTGELRELAEKALAVAELRVQQATAQGGPVRLADLLVDDSWRAALGPECAKPYMAQLQAFLAEEWAKQQIYPPQPLIFRWLGSSTLHWFCFVTLHAGRGLTCSCTCCRAFNSCPIDQARVVIIGQVRVLPVPSSNTTCMYFGFCLGSSATSGGACDFPSCRRTPTTTQDRPWASASRCRRARRCRPACRTCTRSSQTTAAAACLAAATCARCNARMHARSSAPWQLHADAHQ